MKCMSDSSIFEDLQIQDMPENKPSCQSEPNNKQHENKPNNAQNTAMHIIKLQEQNRQLKQRLEQYENNIKYLSQHGLKYAKKSFQSSYQLKNKDKQIQRLQKIIVQNRQKYIIIEANDDIPIDKQNTNDKIKDNHSSNGSHSNKEEIKAERTEFVNNCNRRGVNLENNQQCQILDHIIKEVVQEKQEKESGQDGRLLGKIEEEKGRYTRKDVEDVIEKYLVSYVVQVGEGKKSKISRTSTQLKNPKMEQKIQKQQKNIDKIDKNTQQPDITHRKSQNQSNQPINQQQQHQRKKSEQTTNQNGDVEKGNDKDKDNHKQQESSDQQSKDAVNNKNISKQYIQNKLNIEKQRIIRYVRDFNVMIDYQSELKQKYTPTWNAFKIITNLFKWK